MMNLMPADLATSPATRPVTTIPSVFSAMHAYVGRCVINTAYLPGPPGDVDIIAETLSAAGLVQACYRQSPEDQPVATTVRPDQSKVHGVGFVLHQPDIVLAAAYSEACPVATLVHPGTGVVAMVLCDPGGWHRRPIALTVRHIGMVVSATGAHFDPGDLWAHLSPWPAAGEAGHSFAAAVRGSLLACGLSGRHIGPDDDTAAREPSLSGLRAVMWTSRALG